MESGNLVFAVVAIFFILWVIETNWRDAQPRPTVRKPTAATRPPAPTSHTLKLRDGHTATGSTARLTPQAGTALNLWLYLIANHKPAVRPKTGGSKQAGAVRMINETGTPRKLSVDWAKSNRHGWRYGHQVLGLVCRMGLAREPRPGSLTGWWVASLEEGRAALATRGVTLV